MSHRIDVCPHHPEGCEADPREGQDFDWREDVACPTCWSRDPMFRRNLWWKGEFFGVCSDSFHPAGAGSPSSDNTAANGREVVP